MNAIKPAIYGLPSYPDSSTLNAAWFPGSAPQSSARPEASSGQAHFIASTDVLRYDGIIRVIRNLKCELENSPRGLALPRLPIEA